MKLQLSLEWFLNPDHLPLIAGIERDVHVLVVSLPLITRTPGMLDRVLAVARCPVVLVA